MSDDGEYLRLEKPHRQDIVLGSLPPDPTDGPQAIIHRECSPEGIVLSVEDATALRDALTQWLMDVEVAGG